MSATAVDSADGAAKAVECDSDGTCFSAGTLIGTANGLRPIETIRAGNQVWAYDIVRSDWRLCTVLDNFIRELAGDLVSVTISGDTIESTFRHPYWVISGEDLANRPTFPHIEKVPSTATTPGRWVDAGDLQVGDILLLRDGRQVRVHVSLQGL